MENFRLSENFLKGAFVISTLLLFFIASVGYKQFQSFYDSQRMIIHSHNVQKTLESLVVDISGLETAQRSFIISHDSLFLEEYHRGIDAIFSGFEDLQHINNNFEQQKKIDSLRLMTQLRIQQMNFSLDLYAEGKDLTESLRLGNDQMQAIKSFVQDIGELEDDLLKEREMAGEKQYKVSPILMFSIILFSLFIFTAVYIALNLNIKKYNAAITQLKINNEIFEQAEQISSSGHWYYNFGLKKLQFSNNLYRLFGLDSNIPNLSLKLFLQRVHPNDRKEVIRVIKSLYHYEKSEETIDLKVFNSEKDTICLRMVSTMIIDENGYKVIIGVNKDLTQVIEAKEKLSNLNRELEVQNNIFKNAEMIAGVGSYSFDFENKKYKFSDNLYQILDVDPDKNELSEKYFMELIHPDDIDKVLKNSTWKENVPIFEVTEFRIISGKGAVKYISYNKKILKESGRKMLVVTLKDVSQDTLINKRLEERNLELFHSNTELEAFNHVASHDLQEPLRKIQTFISRIKQMGDLQLTDLAEDYFLRMQKAANRMQRLITDLLSFSRTTNSEKVFEKTRLQNLLDNAIQELAQDIEEKKAVIRADTLPMAHIIPFQIKQLFFNLLHNSLKYSNPNMAPEIQIRNEEITLNDLEIFPNHTAKDLIKISVEDNGIGFEQKYAENIFVLFQRLHNKNNYSGTGIGLAICKKIIDNHGGWITACGKLNQGSKFTFILPKLEIIKS